MVTNQKRLAALKKINLLGTQSEKRFDEITELVTKLFDVPVSLVSLVDKERQFFKSQQGLDEPWASQRETPLSHSFCQYVVESNEPLRVDNATQNPLVKQNLAIEDLNVQAYLGAPLRSPDGYTLGSLCAIDTKPHSWTNEDVKVLEALAKGLTSEIAFRQTKVAYDAIKKELEEAETFLTSIFDAMPAHVTVLDKGGTIVAVNKAWKRFSSENEGATSWLGQNYLEVCDKAEGDNARGAKEVASGIRKVIAGELDTFTHIYACPAPMSERWFLMTVSRFTEGEQLHIVIAHHNISEQKQAERDLQDLTETLEQRVQSATLSLRQSEAKFKAIFNARLGAIISTDVEGKIQTSNPLAEDLFGYSTKGLINRNFWILLAPQIKYQDLFESALEDAKENKPSFAHFQKQDGSLFFGEASVAPLEAFEGELTGYVWMLVDVSDKLEAEKRLKETSQRLARSREEEQRRIARDLHDGPVQDLVGVSFHMSALERSLSDTELKNALKEFRITITTSIKQLRSAITDLRPAGLDEFGLLASLEGHISKVQRQHGLHISLTADEGFSSLPLPYALCIFRGIQEALTNVVKHAEASEVSVRLIKTQKDLSVFIEDNGVGFDMPNDFSALTREQHFGLAGLSERVDLLEGSLRVTSQAKLGTELALCLPLPKVKV